MNPTKTLPVEQLPIGSWFAGSVVADAAGRPLRVFHGTDAVFSRFDFGLVGNPDTEGGPFFTDCRAIAADYGMRVVEAFVVIRKPFRMTYREWLEGDDMKTVPELRALGYDGFVVTDFSSNARDKGADQDFADEGTVFVPFVSADQVRIQG